MSGWNATWTSSLANDTATLKPARSSGGGHTWTDSPMSTDNLPINMVTWYESLAFCAWDQGWLVTEAEWNYAAAGGGEQRVFPWSTDPQAVEDCPHANDACLGAPLPVGSKSPVGDGKWGQSDLAGNVLERMMDTFATPYPLTTCSDCVFTAPGAYATLRGGGFADFLGTHWKTSTRNTDYYGKSGRDGRVGFRCARAP
jgi:formylglycine-generating enzyme required for sulfatase activity